MNQIKFYDGAETPILRTLSLQSHETVNGVTTYIYREVNSALPVSAQLRLTATSQVLKSGVTRLHWLMEWPIMEAVTGGNSAGYVAPPKVAYVETETGTKFVHPRSTEDTRQIVRGMCYNILNGVETSVPPNKTGVIVNLFDKMMWPQ